VGAGIPRGDVTPVVGAGGISLRPVDRSDEAFCVQLYVASRTDEFAGVGWSDGQRGEFLASQYRTRQAAYAVGFPNRSDQLVEHGGRPVGRLIVAEDAGDTVVVDIALIPSARGRGLGTALLAGVLADADRRASPVRLHVTGDNRARDLYLRLGFEAQTDQGPYLSMVRPVPPGAGSTGPLEPDPPVGPAALERFLGVALEDPSIGDRLWGLDEPALVSAVTALGHALGHRFGADDVRATLAERRHGNAAASPRPARGVDLDGWLPIGLYDREGRPTLDWCRRGHQRFTEPFFSDTVERLVADPSTALLRPQTPIDTLGALARRSPGVPVRGFIFHMSRCGSTLVSQMLAARPEHVVVSEAGPIDAVLQAGVRWSVDDDVRIGWLRDLVSVLGRPTADRSEAMFVKFDAWHVFALPLIRRAFPEVPWVFVFRDPLEVLVSHRRQPGSQMLAGCRTMDPGLLGLTLPEAVVLGRDEYGARVLAGIGRAALAAAPQGGLLVDHADLPGAFDRILDHFAVDPSARVRSPMRAAGARDAKHPDRRFVPDGPAKRAEVDAGLRTAAAPALAVHRALLAEGADRALTRPVASALGAS
jgi:ribosomal protein S18 acetylase RimI-like enzyme